MNNIHITSDIGYLKKVLVHRPGEELLNLTPNTLNNLLFDDIPFLPIAQKEHDIFVDKLRENGVEVVYLEDLMTEVLNLNEDIKNSFIKQFVEECNLHNIQYKLLIKQYLENISDNRELVLKTMSGISLKDIGVEDKETFNYSNFIAEPMPNLYFTRDDFACLGEGVSLNRMYSITRNRETIYGEYIFKYHPDYKNITKYYKRKNIWHIEGGDLCVLNEKNIIIGLSERTQQDAIVELARNVFNDDNSTFDNIFIFSIPKKRAFMHLDTVFTQVDKKVFVYHPEILVNFHILQIKKTKSKNKCFELVYLKDSLEEFLENILGENVQLIPCGNGDPIAASREQWSDGSNTLCIKPGAVITYDRNPITNKCLKKAGIKVIEIPSAELSRGRGGPRCMSMPLIREDVEW